MPGRGLRTEQFLTSDNSWDIRLKTGAAKTGYGGTDFCLRYVLMLTSVAVATRSARRPWRMSPPNSSKRRRPMASR